MPSMARHTLAIFISLFALVACNSRSSKSSDEQTKTKPSTLENRPQPRASDVKTRTTPTLAPQVPEEVVEAIASAISQEKAQLLVRVRSSGGKPAVGATVTLLDGSNAEGITALSDAEGLVHFADLLPGSYQLWATDSISISSFHTLAAFAEDIAQPPVDLQLGPASAVSGRIRSFDLGVQATLSLVPIGHDHAIFRTQSKPDGSFLFPAIPRGKWESRITALQHSQPLAKRFTADSDKVYVDLQVVANATIEGMVVDASNSPIADARIRITALGKTQRQSSFELLQSQGSIRWTHPLPGVRTLPKRDSQRFGAKRPGIRPAECGAGHCGVDIGGKRGWPILAAADGQVVVASDDDRGKTGRYVVLAHRGGLRTAYMHMDAVTADLRVGQTVPAGTTLGTLGRSGILRSQPHLHFALSKIDQGQTLFIDPEPMLRFAVVPPETAMVSQSTQYIDDTNVEEGPSAKKDWTSRADGGFAKSSIAPGKYRLQVLHPDYAPGTSVAFILRPGQSLKKLRITLKQGKRHEGQVVGPDGPVLDAWVRAYQGEGESRHRVGVAQVDELGRFVMRPLLGQVSLEVGGAGYGVLRVPTNLNKKAKGLKLYTLSRFDARLRGQLRAPNGTPLVSAQVQIVSGPAGRGRRAHTDAYGFSSST
ncbi:MAG: peptidoglycan DD-metalloendopeptidase family protein [Kofleriaceae bacterium]|nr:peptidoglycan DD-metalloendopeptidase family protein [Kofleriaceae bacterium]